MKISCETYYKSPRTNGRHTATEKCTPETGHPSDFDRMARAQMCHGLIQNGFSYFGLSVSQRLVALDFIKSLPYVDTSRRNTVFPQAPTSNIPTRMPPITPTVKSLLSLS